MTRGKAEPDLLQSVQSVAVSFGQAAETYRQHSWVQRDLGDWLAQWLPPRRKGRVLEIGAGPGLFTQHLIPWPGHLRATDLSPAMCEVGQRQVTEAEWRTMPADHPDPGPWDFMTSCGMLQWVQDPQLVFAAWKKELAPEGRILAGLFVADTLPELQELMGEEGPVRWRSPGNWRALAEAAGLCLTRESAERRVYFFPSAVALMRALHRTGAAPDRKWSTSRMRKCLRDYQAAFKSKEGVRSTWTFYRFEAKGTNTLTSALNNLAAH